MAKKNGSSESSFDRGSNLGKAGGGGEAYIADPPPEDPGPSAVSTMDDPSNLGKAGGGETAQIAPAPTTTQEPTQTSQPQAPQQTPYSPSDSVMEALRRLKEVEAAKPKDYQSKYGDQLDALLQQIMTKKDFKYSFSGDELFKSYADQYTQRGKQASMDAQGQAAALTGGYGNSWGQAVGQQTYDQYLQQLFDKGLDLRNAAYQQYRDDISDLYSQYGTLSQAEQSDYGRYRDAMSQWLAELGYYDSKYQSERGFDYGMFGDERTYQEQLRQFDEQTRQWQQDFEERQRQFVEQMQQTQGDSDRKYAYETAMQLLAQGKMPSDDLLERAGISKADAKKLKKPDAPVANGGGGTRNPQPTTNGAGGGNGGSLLGAQHGATLAELTGQQPTTPQGPVNPQVTPPAPQRLTPQEILQQSLLDKYRFLK